MLQPREEEGAVYEPLEGSEGLSRRALIERGLASAALLTAPGLLAACGGSSGSDGGGGKTTLTFVSYGGAYQKAIDKAWLQPFHKANPDITIVQDQPTNYAKLESMVKSGSTSWDLVDVGNDYGLPSAGPSLTKLDCSKLPCDEMGGQTSTYRIPFHQFAVTMMYRKDKMATPPANWTEFFDTEKFPAKRAMWKYAGQSGLLEFALIADGVAPKQLYPLDVERALRKLGTIKDKIIWWEDVADSTKLLADGEALLGMSFSGRVFDAVNDGVDIGIVWKDAATADDYFVIPKGSKHVDAALKLAAYITSAEHNADGSKIFPLSPTNVQAQSKVSKGSPSYGYLPAPHSADTWAIDDAYYEKNYKSINERFQEWLQS
jgi:putative spermidine/putrescine transport system substrate-binding protein